MSGEELERYLSDFRKISSKERYQCQFYCYVDLKAERSLTPLSTLLAIVRILNRFSNTQTLLLNEMLDDYLGILEEYLRRNLNTDDVSFTSSQILNFIDPSEKLFSSEQYQNLIKKVRTFMDLYSY